MPYCNDAEAVGDGGYAFPCDFADEMEMGSHHGMLLRDWFAGKALSGFIANQSLEERTSNNDIAIYCYEIADAMIKARG